MVGIIDHNFTMVGTLDDVSIDLMILMQGINKVKRDDPAKYYVIAHLLHKLVKEDDKARKSVLEFLENMHDIT